MITSDELAFVRLAMRRRLLNANLVREAVERKKWDRPDRSLPHILVDMGALEAQAAAELRRALSEDKGPARKHETVVAKDPLARDQTELAPRGKAASGGAMTVPLAEREDEEELPPKVPRQIGNYRLVRLLGAGAMGAVYLAEHVEMKREVALKLLMSDGAPSPRAVARFKREARLAAKLDHPNIVRVFEAGVSTEGQHYIAMEMVRGRSVAELLALNEVTPRRAVHIMRKVAEAVGYAHTQGVIHRDLKPANVLVEEATGEARVTDFGLATMSEPDEDDKLTRTGAAVGTPAYMAPEQVKGQLEKIDARTDVYALGATLYEVLTGSPPFEASTFLDLAKKICEKDPLAPRKKNAQVPEAVETICLKALEKEPFERYQTAQEMAKDLGAFLDDAPIVAKAPSMAARARRYARRRPGLVGVLLAALGAATGGLGWLLTRPGHLVVRSSPAGAVLFVDDREVGPIPEGGLPLDVPAGRHQLRFRLDGYLDRALGAEEVQVGMGQTLVVTGQLVSTRGLLRLSSIPGGAHVVVSRADGSPIASGTTDMLCRLEAGTYAVRVVRPPPGFLSPPQPVRATVGAGGQETPLSLALIPDRAVLRIESDPPEDATVREQGGASLVAPALLPGAGRHEVVIGKTGYISRRLTETVPEGTTVERRVTLEPLSAFRRALDGRLLAGPLVRDLDADGFPDLLVLEEGLDGVRLVLLAGAGELEPRFRVATAARRLIDAEDVNGDGVLDVVLGHERGLEVRDGLSGRRLAGLDGIDANAVAVHRPAGEPAQLVFLEEGLRPNRIPINLDPGERRVEPPKERQGTPLVLRGPTLDVALFPLRGGVLVRPLTQLGASFDVPGLEGIGPGSRLFAVSVQGLAASWALALPVGPGRAWLFDPHPELDPDGKPKGQGGRRFPLGDPEGQYVDACSLRAASGEAWLLLTDEKRGALAFQVKTDGARAVPHDAPLGRHPVALGPTRVWTRAGDLLELRGTGGKDGGRWERLPDLSTAAEGLLAPEAQPAVADLDRDGLPELIGPSPDRRSLVALAPWPDRLRWRARSPLPRAAATAVLGETLTRSDLLLVLEDKLLGLSARDGATTLQLKLPGARLVAAGRPFSAGRRSALYTASEVAGAERVQRWAWKGGEWAQAWEKPRKAAGLETIPLDKDGDGEAELLLGGPLQLLRSSDGEPAWSDDAKEPPPSAPAWLPGEDPLCLGLSGTAADPVLMARAAADGKVRWTTPLGPSPAARPAGEDEEGQSDADLVRFAPRVLAREGLDAIAVLFPERVVVFDRKGKKSWERALPIVGGALMGSLAPRLVLVLSGPRGRRELLGLEPVKGSDAWRLVLPEGPGEASAPAPLVVPGSPPQEAAGVVAPSGVALLVALDDGRILSERRGLDAHWLPWTAALPSGVAGEPDALVLARADDRILALEPRAAAQTDDPLERRRIRLRELVRRVDLGDPFVRRTLDELTRIRQEASTDPTVALAVARAQLELTHYAEARRVAQEARDRLPKERRQRLPEAIRIRALTSHGLSLPIDEVIGDLKELAKEDPGMALETAAELARRARGVQDAEREAAYLRQAVALAPSDPGARGELGLELLRWRGFGRLSWKDPDRTSFVEARQRLVEARNELLLALAGGDQPEVRAGGLLALALEEQITVLFLEKARVADAGRRGPLLLLEEDRLREIQALADGLAAGGSLEGGARDGRQRTLLIAREIQAAVRDRSLKGRSALKAAIGKLKWQARWRPLLNTLADSADQ